MRPGSVCRSVLRATAVPVAARQRWSLDPGFARRVRVPQFGIGGRDERGSKAGAIRGVRGCRSYGISVTPDGEDRKGLLNERSSEDSTPHFRPIPAHDKWPITSDKEVEPVKTLPWLSDRAAGIVAMSILENKIEAAIREQLIQDDAKAVDRLFSPDSGPLGTLSAKINIARALGLLSGQAVRDLHLLRKIRNKFAHDISASTFDTEIISSQCLSLSLIDEFVVEEVNFEKRLPRNGGLILEEARAILKVPRSRFFLAVQCYYFALKTTPTPGSLLRL
jgi:DNA-binding MltR family transcriptional regulator